MMKWFLSNDIVPSIQAYGVDDIVDLDFDDKLVHGFFFAVIVHDTLVDGFAGDIDCDLDVGIVGEHCY